MISRPTELCSHSYLVDLLAVLDEVKISGSSAIPAAAETLRPCCCAHMVAIGVLVKFPDRVCPRARALLCGVAADAA